MCERCVLCFHCLRSLQFQQKIYCITDATDERIVYSWVFHFPCVVKLLFLVIHRLVQLYFYIYNGNISLPTTKEFIKLKGLDKEIGGKQKYHRNIITPYCLDDALCRD